MACRTRAPMEVQCHGQHTLLAFLDCSKCDKRVNHWAAGTRAGVRRPHLQHAVKEACKGMAAPDASDLERVKRIAHYLQMVPQVVITGGCRH